MKKRAGKHGALSKRKPTALGQPRLSLQPLHPAQSQFREKTEAWRDKVAALVTWEIQVQSTVSWTPAFCLFLFLCRHHPSGLLPPGGFLRGCSGCREMDNLQKRIRIRKLTNLHICKKNAVFIYFLKWFLKNGLRCTEI